MSGQVEHAALSCAGDELLVQFRISGYEGNVHQGTVFLCNGRCEHFAVIQVIIQLTCLANVSLMHFLNSADALQILEYFAGHVD